MIKRVLYLESELSLNPSSATSNHAREMWGSDYIRYMSYFTQDMAHKLILIHRVFSSSSSVSSAPNDPTVLTVYPPAWGRYLESFPLPSVNYQEQSYGKNLINLPKDIGFLKLITCFSFQRHLHLERGQ